MGTLYNQKTIPYKKEWSFVYRKRTHYNTEHMAIKATIIASAGLAMLIGLMASTTPKSMPVAVFIIFFVVLYAVLAALFVLAGVGMRSLLLAKWQDRQVRRTAYWPAALLVLMLVLQSIGQLTIRDFLLIVGLGGLLYAYVHRFFAVDTSRS